MKELQDKHENIHEMVRRIIDRIHPDKIILFGSYARGDFSPDRDADFLVIMNLQGRKKSDLEANIRLCLRGRGLPKNVIVATPQELEKFKDIVGTIIWPAVHEGKILYKRAA